MTGDADRTLWPDTCHGRWMSEDYEPGLVSVVMPTYNRAGCLVEALESVSAQTYRPVEVLLVDDGSTDETPETVEQWARTVQDDAGLRLRAMRQENQGAPVARNRGLIESRGEFIQFLDSDDLLHPDKLGAQVQVLRSEPEVQFVYAGTAGFYTEPDWDRDPYCGLPVDGPPALEFMARTVWKTESGLYRRALCVQNGPWVEDLRIWQDWEYNIRIASRRPCIRCQPQVLSAARFDSPNRIGRWGRQREGWLEKLRATRLAGDVLEKRGFDEDERAEGLATRYNGIAVRSLQDGFGDVARQAAAAGLAAGPGLRRRAIFVGLWTISLLPRAVVRAVFCRME